MNKVNMQSFKNREKARRYAMQALYSWAVGQHDINDVEKFYRADRNPKNYDLDYFLRLLNAIPSLQAELDATIEHYLDRPFKELDPIELAILRIAAYELLYSFDVPFAVIIHEAVELAQVFGAHDSYKFINCMVDKMAKEIRQNELRACGANS